MTHARDERMSELTTRHEASPEARRADMARNLERCFDPDRSDRLPITHSRRGNPRVRAHIPDEDGYAGWVENASYVGVARIVGESGPTYVAERHFPYASGRPTYLWEFTPATGELYLVRRDGDATTEQLDIALPADPEHEGYFLALTRDMATAYHFNDYEHRLSLPQQYSFELEDLQ